MFLGAKIAVVMPAYNEADKIAAAIAAVPALVDVLVVIDDASRDDTASCAAMAPHQVGVCEVISHAQNGGVGASLSTGYAQVLARHPDVDVIAVMAGDGQMHGDDLPSLLAPVVEGVADYAKGNRFEGDAVWREMPRTRQVGNIVLSLATRAAVGYDVFDSQCGYTAISRRMLQRLPIAQLYPRYGYPGDLLGLLAARRARVVDVPVRPVYGQNWRSGISPKAALHPLPFLLARAAVRARAPWRRGVR
ncbi:MAG: glycosyltransferase family 2 protein [Myxococcales bacterium]|nr:glycosyltransferase family 2 protein [Myxococcales bacterium]